jgi:hypothetical protein
MALESGRAVLTAERNSYPAESPPSYYSTTDTSNSTGSHQVTELPPDLSVRLTGLDLTPSSAKLQSVDLCIAHLKLLEAFYTLRTSIADTADIFGISAPSAQHSTEKSVIKLKEKRWQVYVSRAVHRFETWWMKCVPMTEGGTPCSMPRRTELQGMSKYRDAYMLGIEHGLEKELGALPLDILMVWHAYMLKYVCVHLLSAESYSECLI